MGELDPALVEKAVRAAVAHQRIPTFDDDAGGHRCSGCDHLRGESDGANSPRHVEHQVRAVLDAVAPAIREAALTELLRAAERHAVKRSSFAGPSVESVTVAELRDMAAQQREEQADA